MTAGGMDPCFYTKVKSYYSDTSGSDSKSQPDHSSFQSGTGSSQKESLQEILCDSRVTAKKIKLRDVLRNV